MKDKLSPLSPLTEVIEKRRHKAVVAKENRLVLLDTLSMLGSILLAVVLFTQFFQLRIIKGTDMFPALNDGDLVLAYQKHDLRKNDVIFYNVDGRSYVGRVVAKGGDRLNLLEDGTLIVNGTPQGGDIMFPTYPHESWRGLLEIPKDSVFVLGDYRTHTVDSRNFGPIPLSSVESKIAVVLRHRGI